MMGIYSPLVDLMANADLGGKTVLYMLDAIICAPSEGASITGDNSRWQQAPFNGHYTSSVFVSQDPVAIDSVEADFLMNEPSITSRNGSLRDNPTVENYLHEAGLVADAPSGTTYTDSQGNIVANFDKKRLFYTQGDYGLWQCSEPCHQGTYDNEAVVRQMVAEQRDMRVPSELIPRCPRCGKPMSMNLRADDTFVQDEGWYAAAQRYEDFVRRHSGRAVLYLELGVGMNTPGIIKYPF